MPGSKTILKMRELLNMTQEECAEMIFCTLDYWQRCEKGELNMHQGLWELFNLKVEKRRYVNNAPPNKKYEFHDLDVGETWKYKGNHEKRQKALMAVRAYQTRTGRRYRVEDQGHDNDVLVLVRVN